MLVILALAVCCAVPLLIGAVMVLSGRKKVKSPELVDAEYTTGDPEEADEFLEIAHARRPWARVTIDEEEEQNLKGVKPTK